MRIEQLGATEVEELQRACSFLFPDQRFDSSFLRDLGLVLNQLPAAGDPVSVAEEIRGVSLRYLARDVRCAGFVSRSREVEQSALCCAPALRAGVDGPLRRELRAVVRNLFPGE